MQKLLAERENNNTKAFPRKAHEKEASFLPPERKKLGRTQKRIREMEQKVNSKEAFSIVQLPFFLGEEGNSSSQIAWKVESVPTEKKRNQAGKIGFEF